MTAVQSAAKTPSATVLVIDDDEACRVLLQSALEQSGHSVLVATERQEALGLFERHAIDLVVLDVHLEDSEGPKTCKSLREMPGGMHTPILILTETEDMQAVEAAFEAGANDFATKPLNYRLFSHRVQFLLRTARMASDLRLSEERLATAQRIARIGHWEWQIGAESLWCSRELRRLLGGAVRHAYQGLDLFLKLVHPDDRERVRKIYYEALRKREGFQVDHRIVLPDGSMRAIEQDVQVLPAAKGKPPRVLGIMHDVTDRWRVQHEVRKLSYYDQVTGLPNRTQLVERVTGWIKEETDGEQIALIWIDLDHFERINDTLGHGSGDQLLRCVADRLKLALLEAESHTLWQPPYDPRHKPIISRLGGDEFLIALPHVPTLDNVTLALESLRENIGMATRIQGTEIAVTSSIGVAVFPADGADMDTLMRNAGTAMHRAKNTGRNRYQFFKSEFSERALQHLAIETEMRRAIEDSQFFLEYQPKINLRDNRVEGMEALVRWQHPTLGLITPGDFVPVAEQNGMIVALGRWVLDHTLAQLAVWNQEGMGELLVSVNVSGAQLQTEGFAETVQELLQRHGVPATQLELELTEGLLMTDTASSIRVLSELNRLGVRISIDDFGTGYSSLSYLTRFPISTLKIDRSFVHDLTNQKGNAAIVSATIALAHSLRMHVVAEGVEQRPELDFLRGLGCDSIQGYYFARPMPADDFSEWVLEFGREDEKQAA